MGMNSFIKKSLVIGTITFISIMNLTADSSHKVAKGETLYSISKKYQITVNELRAANNISEKDVIKVGQTLIIPSESLDNAAALTAKPVPSTSTAKTTVYQVQKGDTFYSIARKNGISVAELMALNSMGEGTLLKAGQKLKVPAGNSSSASQSQNAVADNSKNNTSLDIKEADPRKYTEKATSSSIVWPVKSPKISYIKGKVSGVQISAAKNENVVNIRSGTVMYTGFYRGFGQVVFVQSKAGLIYAYTGLSSIRVKKGAYVVYGDVLGKAGIDSITGNYGIMLMVIQDGVYIDPAKAPRG